MTPLLTLTLLAAAPDDALLARLAEHAARAEAIQKDHASLLQVHAEELGDDGKATKLTETVVRLEPKGGAMTRHLVKLSEDGKDLTEAKRQEIENKKPKSERQFHSPFIKDEQPKYRFELGAPDPARPGLVRVALAPAGDATDRLLVGEAWVDPAAGTLVELEAKLSKNPFLVDSMHFRAELLAETPEGPALSRLSVEGVAGLPLFKKHFRVDSRFSEYAKPAPGP